MLTIQDWLAGKKTYIMGALYGIDAFGVQVGWWEPEKFRTTIEMLLTLFALRAGISK